MHMDMSELNSRKLVLASGSPRRKQLLKQAGLQFQVIIPDDSVETGVCSAQIPENFVREASCRKAESVAINLDQAVVIAADTVAVCDGKIMGKPVDREDAKNMLRAMSGKRHFVLTGITVWHRPSNKSCSHVESTELQMAELDVELLEKYLDTDDWIGKAGAFGYQDGLDWVQIVAGYESNVVGLPVEILGKMIRSVESAATK